MYIEGNPRQRQKNYFLVRCLSGFIMCQQELPDKDLKLKEVVILGSWTQLSHCITELEEVLRVWAGGTYRFCNLCGNVLERCRAEVVGVGTSADIHNSALEDRRLPVHVPKDVNRVNSVTSLTPE